MKKVYLFIIFLALMSLGAPPAAQAQGGLPVVTLACDAVLRSQPSESSNALAVLTPDEPLMLITGRDVTQQWVVVLRQNGQTGWLRDNNCLRVQGSRTNAPLTAPVGYEGPPVATVGCTQYIRSAPDDSSARLAILYPSDGLLRIAGRDEQVISRNTVVNWLLIETVGGKMGWVYDPVVRYTDGTLNTAGGSPCIRVRGDVFAAPVTPDITMPVPDEDGNIPVPLETDLPTATVGCTQYIRSAPNNDSARLAILYPEDGTLEILGRDRIAEWLLILSQSGLMGWVVDTQCIVVQDNAFDAPVTPNIVMPIPGVTDALPVADAGQGAAPAEDAAVVDTEPVEEIPLPNAVVGCANYIRSAADNSSARLAILYPGDGVLRILARDRIGEWLLIQRYDGAMGWVVNTDCIMVRGNVFEAPLDTSVVMPIPGVTDGNLDAVPALDAALPVPSEDQTAEALPSPTPLLLPNANLVCTNYVRSAARNDSARLAILYPGDGPLRILARDRIAEWLLVQSPGGLMGWVVNTSCVQVNGNVFEAPLDTSVEMSVPGSAAEPVLPFPGASPPANWPSP